MMPHLVEAVDQGKITQEQAEQIQRVNDALGKRYDDEEDHLAKVQRQSRRRNGRTGSLCGLGHRTVGAKGHQCKTRVCIRATRTPHGEAEYGTRKVVRAGSKPTLEVGED